MSTQGAYRKIDDGLVLQLDVANVKSFKGEPTINKFGSLNNFDPLDLYTWVQRGYQMTISRDLTINTPLGGKALKIITYGNSAYGYSYNNIYNISSASAGQTWTWSYYFKAPIGASVGGLIFGVNTSGRYIDFTGYQITATGKWQRYSFTYTFTNVDVVAIQTRIDIYTSDVTAYFDGVQVEQKDHATPFVLGTRGTTVATGGGLADLSGYSNHGELVNGVLYNSSNCGSLVFDGVNDYLNLGNTIYTQFSHITPWTMSMWFNIVSFTNTYPGILRRGNSTGSGILLWFFNGQNTIRYKHNNTEAPITIPNLIGQWVNLTLVYSGSGNVKAYVNGVYSRDLLPMVGTETTDSLVLGSGDEYGNVKIPIFHKYNRALTQAEITTLYTQTKTRYQ